MVVTNDKVITIVYRITDESGEIVDSNENVEPLEYLHGYQNILPGFEKALTGMQVKEERTVQLEPEEAYGVFRDELIFKVPAGELGSRGEELLPGDVVESTEGREFEVMDIAEGTVTLNGNHPLAGTRPNFTVTVLAIRNATAAEIQGGMATVNVENTCGPGCSCK